MNMSMTLNFLGGAPFQLLYDGVKLAMSNTSKFKTHLRSLKYTLDCLQPQIIEQIRLQNLQLNIPVQEIQELQRNIDEGIVLVDRLSSLSNCNIRVWGSCCSCLVDSYADQLDELNESFRRLLEILRLQAIAQVNHIGILARTTRDKQDELGKRQLEILSNQQYIIDALMKQHQMLERIERNSVAASTGREDAAPVQVLRLREAFQELFDAVVQVKVKNSWFKRFLEDFNFTLDCLKPLVQEIAECNKVVHFPKEDILEDFIIYLEKGVELVYKCSKTSRWNRFKTYEYINSLFELDESLQRLFNILRLQIENDVNEAMIYVSKLEQEIEEIECVLQHHRREEEEMMKESKVETGISVSEWELLEGVAERPPVMYSHANTELGLNRVHHFYSISSEESVSAAGSPYNLLPFATRPSCYSSASSDIVELETVSILNSKYEEDSGLTNPSPEEEEMMRKLSSGVIVEQEEAVISLRKLTRTKEDLRVSLCTPRLLSALKSLIVSRYSTVQVNAVASLVNLSLEKTNKVKIVRSGFIPPLVDVLKSGSSESQEHAVGALFSLALEEDNKMAIGMLGALPPLMHALIRAKSERVRHDSALALYHLTLVESNRVKLVKLNSVPTLLALLTEPKSAGRVLLILCNLAICGEGRSAMLDANAVECLVGMLRRNELDSESTRENCVAALYALSHGLMRFRGLAREAKAVEVLSEIEKRGSERAREKARRLLVILRGGSGGRPEEGGLDWEKVLDSGRSLHAASSTTS